MNHDAPALLRVEDLQRSYGGVAAVAGASFDVAEGSLTALIGPNGAGKTTAFDLISGFARPHDGSVMFAGSRIDGRAPEDVARRGLVRTFQLTRLFRAMSVLDNLLVAGQQHPGESLARIITRPVKSIRREREIRRRAYALLERFGLEVKSSELAGNLSGGQGKLLELARVLMAAPRMILLDEPFAGVNPVLKHELLAHIEEMCSAGVTVLFIEHDLDVVMTHAQHVIVMANGRVIATGAPDRVRRDERVLDAYLGTPDGGSA
jgi:ABC-type branched-subunit amino acid transport system ATPase component